MSKSELLNDSWADRLFTMLSKGMDPSILSQLIFFITLFLSSYLKLFYALLKMLSIHFSLLVYYLYENRSMWSFLLPLYMYWLDCQAQRNLWFYRIWIIIWPLIEEELVEVICVYLIKCENNYYIINHFSYIKSQYSFAS